MKTTTIEDDNEYVKVDDIETEVEQSRVTSIRRRAGAV